MKKIVLLVVLTMISFGINAQEKSDSKTFENAKKLVSISSKPMFDIMINQMSGMIDSSKKQEFVKEIKKPMDSMMSSLARIQMEEFTGDEIKQMLDYYNTPVGKKQISKMGILMKKGQVIGAKFGRELMGIAMKYKKTN